MPKKGEHLTDEQKKHLSEKLKGHPVSQKSREKMRKSHLGLKQSDATKELCRIKSTCRKHTEETKKLLSEIHIGERNPMFGSPLPEWHRKKISDSNKGRKQPIAAVLKGAAKRTGVKHSDEHRKHNAESRRGKKLPTIVKEKMQESRILYLNDIWYGGVKYPEDEYNIIELIHSSPEYNNWRNSVYRRDNFRDWFSGIKLQTNIQAHHIISLKDLIAKNNIKTLGEAMNCKEIWDVNNGVTMLDYSHYAYHQMWGN